jgi:hypothetical protein
VLIAPTIFYFVWTSWHEGSAERDYTQYSFKVGPDKFLLELSKEHNDFSISEVINEQRGEAREIYYGNYRVKGDSVKLESGKYDMFILNHELHDFPNDSSSIPLHK